MASNDPGDEKKPEPSGSEAGPGADALSRLEERLGRASDAAERLIAEAAGTAARGPRTPPAAGWQAAEPEGEGEERESRRGLGELETLLAAIGSLRELIPPDLQRRLADALRELLLALRALIDWYLERAKQVRAEPAEVQDIPIA
jgi:hypothetical protein